MDLAARRLTPSSDCGAFPEIRQDGLPKPGGPAGTTTDPQTFAAPNFLNFLTKPPLTKLNELA